MAIYFSSESEKLDPYIKKFEQSSRGTTLKETLIEALKYANILHSKRFGTTVNNG